MPVVRTHAAPRAARVPKLIFEDLLRRWRRWQPAICGNEGQAASRIRSREGVVRRCAARRWRTTGSKHTERGTRRRTTTASPPVQRRCTHINSKNMPSTHMLCTLLMLLAIGGGAEAHRQHWGRQHNLAHPRLGLSIPAFRSVAHPSPLLRQPRHTAPETSRAVHKDDYEQQHLPCSAHSDCKGGDGYCRQAVGGLRCSPCVDYRMHTCDDWRDSIDGNCEVCRVHDSTSDPQRPAEPHIHAHQEAYEEQAIAEAIAAPIYGQYGELRSEPSPPTQTGAGRKDFVRQRHHDSHSHAVSEGAQRDTTRGPAPLETTDTPSGSSVLANLKAPERADTHTEPPPCEGPPSDPCPEPSMEEQRAPAHTSAQRWFSSTASEQRWPGGGRPPVSSTVRRTLQPGRHSGATVERQILHRVVGDKEVRDTLTFRHGQREEDTDKHLVGDSPAARQAAASGHIEKTATPQRQMRNIATEQELAEFERYFESASGGQQLPIWDLPHPQRQGQGQGAASWYQPQRAHTQQQTQRQVPRKRDSAGGLLRMLDLAFHAPVSPAGAAGWL